MQNTSHLHLYSPSHPLITAKPSANIAWATQQMHPREAGTKRGLGKRVLRRLQAADTDGSCCSRMVHTWVPTARPCRPTAGWGHKPAHLSADSSGEFLLASWHRRPLYPRETPASPAGLAHSEKVPWQNAPKSCFTFRWPLL